MFPECGLDVPQVGLETRSQLKEMVGMQADAEGGVDLDAALHDVLKMWETEHKVCAL
jgi:hypothetical protein